MDDLDVIDLETAAPGTASMTWIGHQLRPFLAPLTLRSRPRPLPVKLALGTAAIAAIALLGARQADRRRPAR